MRKILLLVLLATSFLFSNCEKDDICDANTPTTPRLLLSFYDINNPTVLKNVNQLKVIGEGMSEGIPFNPTSLGDSKYLTNASSIAIPLKTDSDSSTYHFIYNYGNSNPALVFEDILTINYSRKAVFVSRACGYKTLFTLNDSNPIIHLASPASNPTWMQYLSVEKINIENENETHLKIFF